MFVLALGPNLTTFKSATSQSAPPAPAEIRWLFDSCMSEIIQPAAVFTLRSKLEHDMMNLSRVLTAAARPTRKISIEHPVLQALKSNACTVEYSLSILHMPNNLVSTVKLEKLFWVRSSRLYRKTHLDMIGILVILENNPLHSALTILNELINWQL